MKLKKRPFGSYKTNCYILSIDEKDIIVDPGMGAAEWVIQNVKNPIAILNTHGHFDHIYDNKILRDTLNVPVICHALDGFLLERDIFNLNTPEIKADILATSETLIKNGIKINFLHFPGHTPGCCMIEVEGVIFSGDFIFCGSIGRFDFPYSNKEDMKSSLEKFLKLDFDTILYTGHGSQTTIKEEQKNVKEFLLTMF